MGERVVIRDEPPLASEAPPQGVPLGYGQGDAAGNAWRWLKPRLHATGDATRELLSMIVAALGGWRQIAFALGLACSLAGLGHALASVHHDEAAMLLFIGGLLVGLALRVPWLKRER